MTDTATVPCATDGLNTAIATALASIKLGSKASRDEVALAFEPLTSSIVEAMSQGEDIDLETICGRICLTIEQAEWAEPLIDEAFERGLAKLPIMRLFAQHRPVHVLRGLCELSFAAGLAGDDEHEWSAEADEALIDAFGFQRVRRVDWLDTARAAMGRAFTAGVAQQEIDRAFPTPPTQVLAVAKARAIVYADEIEHPSEGCPSAIDSAVGFVAYKLAERHQLTPAEAAHAAMSAFHGEGMSPSLQVTAWALDRATAGHAERVAGEAYVNERILAGRSVVAQLFGVEA